MPVALLLIKLQVRNLQLYLKWDFSTGFFLLIVQNPQEHLFYRRSMNSCF